MEVHDTLGAVPRKASDRDETGQLHLQFRVYKRPGIYCMIAIRWKERENYG